MKTPVLEENESGKQALGFNSKAPRSSDVCVVLLSNACTSVFSLLFFPLHTFRSKVSLNSLISNFVLSTSTLHTLTMDSVHGGEGGLPGSLTVYQSSHSRPHTLTVHKPLCCRPLNAKKKKKERKNSKRKSSSVTDVVLTNSGCLLKTMKLSASLFLKSRIQILNGKKKSNLP